VTAGAAKVSVQLAGIEQGLGGNAADVQAGAADALVFLHQRAGQSQLGGANRRHITAGTGSDYQEIVHRSYTSSSKL
jgi:hypothetical protein